MIEFHATTICAVKKDNRVAIAGDGQVTMGQSVVMKNTAQKVRRLYNGKIISGFAGSVADAFYLISLRQNSINTMVNYYAVLWNLPRNGVVTRCSAI